MRFINRGESVKIRIGGFNENFYWITCKKGETMDLPEQTGRNNHFEEVTITESKIGAVKVETKQFEKVDDVYTPDDDFFKELKKIKGIGPKMARDVVVWGTREKLVEQISLKAELPFRDDIVKLLEEKYAI